MKKLKMSISALALVLGFSAAFATTTRHNMADRRWHQDSQGVWTEVEDGTYNCLPDDAICTQTFDSRVNPNDQENDTYPGTALPSDQDYGIFVN